jgi:hypothetical protein
MTGAESLRLVAMVSAAYPTPAWPRETIQLYVQELLDLPYDPAAAAVHDLIRTRLDNERPSIGRLRTLIGERKWSAEHTIGSPEWKRLHGEERRQLTGPRDLVRQLAAHLARPVLEVDAESVTAAEVEDAGVLQRREERREVLREQARQLQERDS